MSLMNVLTTTLIALILGACVALYFGVSAAAAASQSSQNAAITVSAAL